MFPQSRDTQRTSSATSASSSISSSSSSTPTSSSSSSSSVIVVGSSITQAGPDFLYTLEILHQLCAFEHLYHQFFAVLDEIPDPPIRATSKMAYDRQQLFVNPTTGRPARRIDPPEVLTLMILAITKSQRTDPENKIPEFWLNEIEMNFLKALKNDMIHLRPCPEFGNQAGLFARPPAPSPSAPPLPSPPTSRSTSSESTEDTQPKSVAIEAESKSQLSPTKKKKKTTFARARGEPKPKPKQVTLTGVEFVIFSFPLEMDEPESYGFNPDLFFDLVVDGKEQNCLGLGMARVLNHCCSPTAEWVIPEDRFTFGQGIAGVGYQAGRLQKFKKGRDSIVPGQQIYAFYSRHFAETVCCCNTIALYHKRGRRLPSPSESSSSTSGEDSAPKSDCNSDPDFELIEPGEDRRPLINDDLLMPLETVPHDVNNLLNEKRLGTVSRGNNRRRRYRDPDSYDDEDERFISVVDRPELAFSPMGTGRQDRLSSATQNNSDYSPPPPAKRVRFTMSPPPSPPPTPPLAPSEPMILGLSLDSYSDPDIDIDMIRSDSIRSPSASSRGSHATDGSSSRETIPQIRSPAIDRKSDAAPPAYENASLATRFTQKQTTRSVPEALFGTDFEMTSAWLEGRSGFEPDLSESVGSSRSAAYATSSDSSTTYSSSSIDASLGPSPGPCLPRSVTTASPNPLSLPASPLVATSEQKTMGDKARSATSSATKSFPASISGISTSVLSTAARCQSSEDVPMQDEEESPVPSSNTAQAQKDASIPTSASAHAHAYDGAHARAQAHRVSSTSASQSTRRKIAPSASASAPASAQRNNSDVLPEIIDLTLDDDDDDSNDDEVVFVKAVSRYAINPTSRGYVYGRYGPQRI
ncbi:hypothetical protein IAT40_005582 [Kwoniella sp. CBS 6097]